MLMLTEDIKKGVTLLNEEGFLPLIRAVFTSAKKRLNIVFTPLAVTDIKNLALTTPEALVDFALNRYWGIIKPAQVKNEVLQLANRVHELKPKTILEVGTAKGGTLFLFSRLAADDAVILSVDLPGGKYGGGYSKLKNSLYHAFTLPKQKLHLIRANSHDRATFDDVKALLGERKVDFLFIDGDHTYDGVKKDFEMYSKLVEDGGLVALHDVAVHTPDRNCTVDIFWQELRQTYKHTEEIIDDVGQGWAGIGLVHGLEKSDSRD
jgi:predicted O-methyltransferase YrrM